MARRYRASIMTPVEGHDEIKSQTLHPTRDRALKEGIDMALEQGLIVVTEVEAEQKVRREWVEKE